MPTLHDAQRLLWQLIAAPVGGAAALAGDADRGGARRAALTRTVCGDERLDAVARLDIYANMYFFRVLDVLKEHYAATHALLGEVTFHNLITDYLLRHPPTHFSIREAGRHVPELLAEHDVRAAHPCAADLARAERALNDAFDAADAPALTAAALAAVAADAWPSLRLTLHPAVRLLDCGWPVHGVRAAVERGEPAADPSPAPTRLCVWRQDLVVFHRPVEPVEFAALRALERGERFDAACAAAGELLPEGEAAQRVAAALAGWLPSGLLADHEAHAGRTP
jgi:hypothetical protein